MGRGRKPKPTAVKKLEGNPGRRPLNKHEPKPPVGVGDAPDWLDDVGKNKWAQKKDQLEQLNIVTTVDDDALAVYCQAYSDFVYAVRFIEEKDCRVCVSEKGAEYQHPMVGQRNKAAELIIKYGVHFGLTPSSRTGLNVDLALPEDDEVAEMMGE